MSENKNVEKRDNTQEIQKERKTYPACCDIYSEGDKVVLQLEMPGVSRENLQVNVDGDLLIVHGHKWLPAADGEFHIREIPDGDYHQEYTLDDTIDRDKISASISNGIVTITMQLKEAVKPRKIKINAK
ncbi:MAG: Hsp20/alpha crystallin family protein [Spirochaetales bacterium]|nr:Hsp20/alpha crystallin family protein [Spirochaetales bacterium]